MLLFMAIFLVSILSFGIFAEVFVEKKFHIRKFLIFIYLKIKSILNSDTKLGPNVVKDIIDIAYWPIYGEMKVLDKINEQYEAIKEDSYYSETLTIISSYAGLMAYMILVNVLLVNLLIAMFR